MMRANLVNKYTKNVQLQMVGRYRQLKCMFVGQGIEKLVDKLQLDIFQFCY
jgi:hypothetical protein